MVGKVHCKLGTPPAECAPGPDYYVPGNHSALTQDEVISYASMVAIFRSTWWPSGALSEMDAFTVGLLTNDAVIRITMMSENTRQNLDHGGRSFAGPGIVWSSDDVDEHGWKYTLLVNRAEASGTVGVDLDELGYPPGTGCNATDLWSGESLGVVYGVLQAPLRPHASRLVRLSGCRAIPHRPPTPPDPAPPTGFCPADNISACAAAFEDPGSSAGTCSADFEHVEPTPIPRHLPETFQIDALYIDVQGNSYSDLHVVGVIYSDDAGSPGALVATSTPVVVPARAARSLVRLPFAAPVTVTRNASGSAGQLWLGEQAGAAAGVPVTPGGPNSLLCFHLPASSGRPPVAYTAQPYAKGPKATFGVPTIASSSLSVFAATSTPTWGEKIA